MLREALGDSLPGVLVCDFYASYNFLNAKKQRCLVHLLRELHTLRENIPSAAVKNYVQPLMTLLQEAIELGKCRGTLTTDAFNDARVCAGDNPR